MATAGAMLALIAIAVIALSWRAGGHRDLREISEPVAVPELQR